MTPPIPRPLYHYTCDHAIDAIRYDHVLRPHADLVTGIPLVWLTDLAAPARRALGLTSNVLRCNRTRYRLVVPEPVNVHRWVDVKRTFPAQWAAILEMAPGVLPMHWYVAYTAQQIEAEVDL